MEGSALVFVKWMTYCPAVLDVSFCFPDQPKIVCLLEADLLKNTPASQIH